jgi:hypothetical protein
VPLEDVCVLCLNDGSVVAELLNLLDGSLLVGRIRGRECYVMPDHGHFGIYFLENACQPVQGRRSFHRTLECSPASFAKSLGHNR